LTPTRGPRILAIRPCSLAWTIQVGRNKVAQGCCRNSANSVDGSRALSTEDPNRSDRSSGRAGVCSFRPTDSRVIQASALSNLKLRVWAVAEVAKTFGSSRCRTKLLASSATPKSKSDRALVFPGCPPRSAVTVRCAKSVESDGCNQLRKDDIGSKTTGPWTAALGGGCGGFCSYRILRLDSRISAPGPWGSGDPRSQPVRRRAAVPSCRTGPCATRTCRAGTRRARACCRFGRRSGRKHFSETDDCGGVS
jgi:hypothetical protein